ncbi:MAG: ATP-binding protein [Anaerolineales bacterium]
MTNSTTPINKSAVLSQTFVGLTEDEIQDMAHVTRAHTYPPGHVLCHEGAYEEVFYILASGEAVITKAVGEDQAERVLRVVGQGDFVGEMALIQNAPRAASVRALTEVDVLEMAKSDFEAMLSRSPHMALNIIRITLNRMRQNDQMAIEDLRRTNKVLAQLDRNKLEFIQVAAHELRTPLTVMKGYINVMKLDNGVRASSMLMEVLDGLSKGTERLHEIVNTMLDVSRIDNEGLRLSVVPVPLKSVVNDIANRIQKEAEAGARKLTFTLEHTGLTPIINADPTLIQKAVYHLIINAVKYTPDGGTITIRTKPLTLEGDAPGAEIVVQDTGIGLDAEHKDLIFEKFYQVGAVALHSSSKVAFKGGGPGLGLAIAKGVARAHGGKIWVESTGYDEQHFPGCTFTLQLPITPPPPPANAKASTGPLKG